MQEYLVGFPSPPALHDLEDKCGPAAVKGKPGIKLWRSGNGNAKEGNNKKKNWCVRKPVYALIDAGIKDGESEDEIVERLEELLKQKVGTKLVGEQNEKRPGSTGMQMFFSAMAKEKDGSNKRSQEAKARAQK